jgi:hypothetical protein
MARACQYNLNMSSGLHVLAPKLTCKLTLMIDNHHLMVSQRTMQRGVLHVTLCRLEGDLIVTQQMHRMHLVKALDLLNPQGRKLKVDLPCH